MSLVSNRSLVLFAAAALLAVSSLGCADTTEGGSNTGDGGGTPATGSGGGGGGDVKQVCEPGAMRPCDNGGTQQCIIQDGEAAWDQCTQPGPTGTPLVLVFDGAPVSFQADATHAFDLTGAASYTSDWPTARTPWLALDRDGDGAIGDGGELFGSATVLSTGARATNGFDALRELDSNHDGVIDARDARFGELVVWADRDGDRRSTAAELTRASSVLLSIDLGYHASPRCDARGNCEIERATFRYVDAAGAERIGHVVDVHLALR
ncbi:MAG TPA: calcium-binding protein [Byssovorax sp.]|jgi:hypothetical protein